MSRTRADDLLEANEHLVLAVIRAQDDAARALQALREAPRSPRLDAMIGSPDGALLFDRLTHALAVARRSGTRLGLLIVNIENLEEINDTMGHARGEQVLKFAAQRLSGAVRDSDVVSRHGDHEFLVLLTALSQSADALNVADSAGSAMTLPLQVDGQDVRLKARIGISVYPDDGDDGDALMDRATAAMYHARRGHLGSYFFQGEPGTNARSLELRKVESLQLPGRATTAGGEPELVDVQKEANEQLLLAALHAHELLAASELAHRKQVEFMGMVAHELRGPLGPLSNAAALLGLAKAKESVMPMVKDIIDRQVAHLARLVADLLDVARVNVGKLRLDVQRLDLQEVLRDCADAADPAIAARGQSLAIETLPEEIPVNGDRVRLTQVFRNLLDNASKYTQQGGAIVVTAIRGTGRVTVLVSDNGIGITPEALPHVFDRYVQERRATTFDATGLGIGLALVRDLVEAHDGKVIAESAGPGLGSRFSVSLPLRPVRD
jgi:diguanylate cyclase (GGDEF)-like protein